MPRPMTRSYFETFDDGPGDSATVTKCLDTDGDARRAYEEWVGAQSAI